MYSRIRPMALAWALPGLALVAPSSAQDHPRPFRPPSVPLVACDPYFSVWSPYDHLTDGPTRHWTGKPQPLSSLVRIDGRAYRLMGDEPKRIPAWPQVDVRVLPTRTIYAFEGPEARVTLTFTTPALPADLEVFARPITYVTWDVAPRDGKPHNVAVYFAAGGELAVDTPDQKVVAAKQTIGNLAVSKVGTEEQPVLVKRGDDRRIDWGYAYVAAPAEGTQTEVGVDRSLAKAFATGVDYPKGSGQPSLEVVMELGRIEPTAKASRHLTLAYDDGYSITYFRKKLRPYWRRNGAEAADLLTRAEADYNDLTARCAAFDDELMADLKNAGGEKYATLAALAYRQSLAAHKLAADANGQPLYFSKENFSNGCIATVDIIYPTAPILLLFSPTLAKASLVPVLAYGASDRWKFPFAPHDLGTYPLANGQVYGGGERTEDNQMPVEETGNVLIVLAAIARLDGDASFAEPYWPLIKKWAGYLESKGFDPDNQLCTDDFAGHLAHNVNLSAKAIMALGSYGRLCELRGDKAEAERIRKVASEFARLWPSRSDDGDHTRLAFDRPKTWSQKYNLVWDRLLGLELFEPEVIRREIAYYLGKSDRYGVPLDNRQPYAKVDWTVWTATMAENRADFERLVDPLYHFLDESPSRVPMNDWYWTRDGKQAGFQARSVVGGVFIKLLADPKTWTKWAGRDKAKAAGWAALPAAPVVRAILPTAKSQAATWEMTTRRPADNWMAPSFDASSWKKAEGGFGTRITPGTDGALRTEWNSPDIWIRREFNLPDGPFADLQFECHHDEDVEIYLNGVLAARASGYTSEYDLLPIAPAARATLKAGENVLAVHCRQTTGGQYIDVGIVDVKDGGQ